jgi:predicted metal-dependent hydrolase
MRRTHTPTTGASDRISLAGRQVEFRLIPSRFATKLRVRVGVAGVEVIRPEARGETEVSDFLRTNAAWIVSQLERVEGFRSIRRPRQSETGQILFRGESTTVSIAEEIDRTGANRIDYDAGRLVILRSSTSGTPPAKSLENWLRKQARTEIFSHLETLTGRLKREPGKVLIMGQRTKWGNCSALQNLSFNWRLIMAPAFVLRYLVTHEAVHLAVPDHSQKFWLTVRSLCPESERARQWLCANGHRLLVDLNDVCMA